VRENLAFVDRLVRGAALLDGPDPITAPGDRQAAAEAAWERDDAARALGLLRPLLADPTAVADRWDRVLYLGAVSACAVAAGLPEAEARALEGEALGWLGDDLKRRREEIARLSAEIPSAPLATRGFLVARRRTHESVVDRIRSADSDLARLRPLPGFRRLFEADAASR
jgi:hypothetical protein